MSRKGKALIERIAGAGGSIDIDALTAPFNFTVSPISSTNVDVHVIVSSAKKIKALTRASGLSITSLTDILIFPTLLLPTVPGFRESTRFNVTAKSYLVKRRIDIDVWLAADVRSQRELLINFLAKVVDEIPEKHVDARSKAMINEIVQRSFQK